MLKISLPSFSFPKPITLAHTHGEIAQPPVSDEPPVDALIDADGFHIVDRFGCYLIPQP